MKNIIIALAEELANTLRHKNGLREDAEAERKRAVEAFYEKYEGTEYEDEANMVDVVRAMRKAHSEACKIAEQMRRASGIFIE